MLESLSHLDEVTAKAIVSLKGNAAFETYMAWIHDCYKKRTDHLVSHGDASQDIVRGQCQTLKQLSEVPIRAEALL